MNRADLKGPHAKLGALSSQGQADREDDHSHALSWLDINRVLFVAAAAGAMCSDTGSYRHERLDKLWVAERES